MVSGENRETAIPAHVAIILDGNGRWAKAHGLPRNAGHLKGAAAVENILTVARDMGIKYLTVYAFSTENWSRPEDEVRALMKLLADYLVGSIKKSMKNNVRCRVIGERGRLSPKILESIERLEEATRDNTGLQFTIAINYGSRDEITRAVRRIAAQATKGQIDPASITEEDISAQLDTADLPDPDLLIRTAGEQRLSNFLLWQLAYAEFYYTDTAWPDFDKKELEKAVAAYGARDRKYGGLKDTSGGKT